MRLWGLIRDWLGLSYIDVQYWPTKSIQEWRTIMTKCKDLASITLLASWEILNEPNARMFTNKHAPPSVILGMIKYKAKLWVLAGAERLSNFILGD
jgi:hypothetical protein